MSKLERRNQAKQKRLNSNAQHTHATSVFAGRDGAPRIVAVVPLCEDVSGKDVVRKLNEAVDVIVEESLLEDGTAARRVHVERFKQNVSYIVAQRDLLAVLDACRLADFVLFVLSANEEVDAVGEMLLKSVESQGISNVLAVAQVRCHGFC
jgi:pre-rRNA-processing protein TSR1